MESEPVSYPVLDVEDAVRRAEESVRGEPPARALGVLENLRERFPRVSRLWSLSAHLLGNLGRRAEAEAGYRQALVLDPGNAWATRELCDLLCERESRESIDEAHSLVVGLLDRDPLDPYNHGYLGDLLYRKGNAEGSKAAFRTALWLKPDYSWASCRLALVLCRGGNPEEARQVLSESLESRPDEAWTLACLGCVERRLGRDDDAEHSFRRALDLEPALETAFQGLHVLLLEKGREAEARTLLSDFQKRTAQAEKRLPKEP